MLIRIWKSMRHTGRCSRYATSPYRFFILTAWIGSNPVMNGREVALGEVCHLCQTAGMPARVEEQKPVTAPDDSSGGGTQGPRIRCPKCGWKPGARDRWQCECRHIWNTFDT